MQPGSPPGSGMLSADCAPDGMPLTSELHERGSHVHGDHDRRSLPHAAHGGEGAFAREHPTVWGSADDGPFDADALRAHDERGFTILPDFITGEEVETYQAELDRLTSDPSLRGD